MNTYIILFAFYGLSILSWIFKDETFQRLWTAYGNRCYLEEHQLRCEWVRQCVTSRNKNQFCQPNLTISRTHVKFWMNIFHSLLKRERIETYLRRVVATLKTKHMLYSPSDSFSRKSDIWFLSACILSVPVMSNGADWSNEKGVSL